MSSLNLSLDVAEVKKELSIPEPDELSAAAEVDPELEAMAEQFASPARHS